MSSLGRMVGTPLVAALLLGLAGNVGAAEGYKLVNEGEIGNDWALADGVKLSVPGYPVAFAERGDNVCVALGYAIKPDGTTSEFTVLKKWNSSTGATEKEPAQGYWDAFVQAGANSVAQWKFKPRVAGTTPRATFTVTTLSFVGQPESDATALRGECAVGDLAAFVQEQKASAFMASSARYELEHAQLRADQRRMDRQAAELERLAAQVQ